MFITLSIRAAITILCCIFIWIHSRRLYKSDKFYQSSFGFLLLVLCDVVITIGSLVPGANIVILLMLGYWWWK